MRLREALDGLHAEVTARPYSRIVDDFCCEYQHAFVVRNERESRAGLRLCLSLNGPRGDALHARFGPSREHIALLRDGGGAIAAGMNFICFPMGDLGNIMTVHTVYVFVAPAWRGRGLLRIVYQRIEAVAREYARTCGLSPGTEIMFIGEQRDPFAMTPARFAADVAASGQDPFDRLAMWAKLGARILLFRYVQPPLAAGGAPDQTLFLRILFRKELNRTNVDAASRVVDPQVLKEHLIRFFAVSVAKGRYDPTTLPSVRDQIQDLDARLAVGGHISAQAMPSPAKLSLWKRDAARVLALGGHPEGATIGSLLQRRTIY